MEFKGKVISRTDEKSGVSTKTGKAWKTFEFVVENTETDYTKHAVFKVFGDSEKADKILALTTPNTGRELTVSFNVDAQEWKGKYYNSLLVYKVEYADQAQPQQQGSKSRQDFPPPPPTPQNSANVQGAGADLGNSNDNSELPF